MHYSVIKQICVVVLPTVLKSVIMRVPNTMSLQCLECFTEHSWQLMT